MNVHNKVETFKIFKRSDWPADFEPIRNNLLWSSISDDELLENNGKSEILPSLLKRFRKYRPQHYAS